MGADIPGRLWRGSAKAHRRKHRQAAGAVAARLTGLPTSILGIGSGPGVELATADVHARGVTPR
jgi:hypothetical protein